MIEEIKNQTIYKTSDNCTFTNKEAAELHEGKLSGWKNINKYQIKDHLFWNNNIINNSMYSVYCCRSEEEYHNFIDNIHLAHYLDTTENLSYDVYVKIVDKTTFIPKQSNYYVIIREKEYDEIINNELDVIYIFNLMDIKHKVDKVLANINRILDIPMEGK